MKAKDIMTQNPEVVTSKETVTQAARVMRDLDVGIVPVVRDRKEMDIEGVITDRDIAVRHVAEGHEQQCSVSDHMSSDHLDSVTPDSDVNHVMSLMRRDQVRRVPVVEDGNRVVGIIAQADLAIDEGPKEPKEVEETVEKISEPGHPKR